MLVISRRPHEKILFPEQGISIQVVQTKGHLVRLGVEAPRDVPVLREELATPENLAATRREPETDLHRLRNEVHKLGLGLQLVRRQLAAGKTKEAAVTFQRLEQSLESAQDCLEARESCRRGSALIVEDDHNERELLAGYLSMSGFEVSTAGDGLEALERLERQPRPDVVLMDLRMPRCDGRKTVETIRGRAEWRDLKVIALSGSHPKDMGLTIGREGVDAWFAKPLDPQKLKDLLQRQATSKN